MSAPCGQPGIRTVPASAPVAINLIVLGTSGDLPDALAQARPGYLVTRVSSAHFLLLALHREMLERYQRRTVATDRAEPAAIVVIEKLAALRVQLDELWREQFRTEGQPRTSPALEALEQLRRDGGPVGLHLRVLTVPGQPGSTRGEDPPRRRAHSARLWRGRLAGSTARWAS